MVFSVLLINMLFKTAAAMREGKSSRDRSKYPFCFFCKKILRRARPLPKLFYFLFPAITF
jgi:hypothetical protein